MTFIWGLKRRDAAAGSHLLRISDPSKPGYRAHLSQREVALRFGATSRTEEQVRRFLRGRHLRAKIDRSRLFLRVKGTASEFEAAFGQPIEEAPLPGDGDVVMGPADEPAVPRRIARLAPDRYWFFVEQTPGARTATGPRVAPLPNHRERSIDSPLANQGTVVRACAEYRANPAAPFTYSPAQLVKAYGIGVLRASKVRRRGPGAGIGIVSLGEGFSDRNLRTAQRCFTGRTKMRRVRTDGMRGKLVSAPASEADLDVQVVSAALGTGRATVYEALGSPIAPQVIQSFILATSAALNQPNPDRVLSMSYGLCEEAVTSKMTRLLDAVFIRLGLIGTSVLAAAGDYGSSDCMEWFGTGQRSVNYPASSPWVTAVGGSKLTLDGKNKRQSEVVWNNTPFGQLVGGGGGTSTLYARPSWQKGTSTGRRAVPELSAHAGYPAFPVMVDSADGFAQVQGTSAATPLVASGIALLNEQLAGRGDPPLGFLNPWLYRLPRRAYFDIVRTDNDLFGVGCCQADRGYDLASGRGAPRFQELADRVG